MSMIHVPGCWVSRKAPSGKYSLGVVCRNRQTDTETEVEVFWIQERRKTWTCPTKIRSGFKNGMDVIDRSPNSSIHGLGRGIIIQHRCIAGHEQLLVDFPDSGKKRWLPYQHLEYIQWVHSRYYKQQPTIEEDTEKMRLRILAQAIRTWNENTGSLSQLDIDPLPHQIHLVHHILASGNYNWLIADDVGLGKTGKRKKWLMCPCHRPLSSMRSTDNMVDEAA